MISKKKPKSDIKNPDVKLIICTNPKHEQQGSLIKGSKVQLDHIKRNKHLGKCKIKKYDPKKDNPEYKKAKIANDNTSKDTRSESRILFDLAMSNIKKLYIQDNNQEEVYALVPINNHTEFINISSSRAINWLSDLYSKLVNDDEIYGEDFYKKVSHAIESYCKINISDRTRFYNRIAQLDNSVWYDLGTDEHNAVKITKKGAEIVNLDITTPFFERTQSTHSQVLPIYDNQNALLELATLLKIKPENTLMFMVHVVCLFFSEIPIPIMVFDGTAGSIKTTTTATIKRIVDPSGISKLDNVNAMSKKPDDLIVQLEGEYMLGFDNVSYVDPDTSDILCRAITGATNVKRKLFKNKERVMLKFMSKIVLNGVIPTLEYPDLQTRILNYERLTVDSSNMMLESDFEIKLKLLMPQILGNIFTLISDSLQDYPKLSKKIKPKTRMADFEVRGEIVSRRLGFEKNEFLNRYYEKLKTETIKSQDAYPIISAIQELMIDREVYENSATELYSKLCFISEKQGINTKDRFTRFPKGSNKLVGHIRSIESNLRTCGFDITRYYYTKRDNRYPVNTSIIKISKKEKQTTLIERISKVPLASLTSLAEHENTENQAQNLKKRAKGTAKGTNDSKTVPLAQNTDSRHEKPNADEATEAKGTFNILSDEKTKQKEHTKIVTNLDQTKQYLRKSGFEIWNNGTVRCKLCNGKMDIPSAINHTCHKREVGNL